ncbi:MAG: polyprenyl synthetase family protein [Streptococcaceae bacterium]|jgi:geranylgeranyl diphosphate synthase type II|nr:polyprenyl synthetase family protein [Streptococcaceae bacterium]
MNNQAIKEKIDDCLLAFYSGTKNILTESITYSIKSGGKRFRPLLLASVLAGFDKPFTEEAIKVAAALEMIHTSSLIHDDLPSMDNDDFRRGVLTNHKRFGEANAILAGDALLLDPFNLLSQTAFSAKIIVRLVQELSKASGFCGMVGGQSIDINSENQALAYEALRELHAKKTGAMIVFPFVAAGIIAEQSEETINQLRKIGENIGLAFQIHDDIIDVTSSFQALGKTPKKDLAENKATYVTLLGLDQAKLLLSEEIAQANLSINQLKDFNHRQLAEIIEQLMLKE